MRISGKICRFSHYFLHSIVVIDLKLRNVTVHEEDKESFIKMDIAVTEQNHAYQPEESEHKAMELFRYRMGCFVEMSK